jgi:RNA polymerase sigma-B factor
MTITQIPLTTWVSQEGIQLTRVLSRAPTVTELAAHLELDEELVIEALGTDDFVCADCVNASAAPHRPDAATSVSVFAQCAPWERQLLELHFRDGLSLAEVGARVGISQSQVGRLISRTLHRTKVGVLVE